MTPPLRLSAVAEALRVAGLLVAERGSMDVEVEGVSQDSRAVDPGDLFLAWAGTHHDAHDYVESAAESGAVAAVVERPVPSAPVPQLQVSDGRSAAALAADRLMGEPWRSLHLVAVTGTNGKTTTATLARHLLQQRMDAGAVGTLGVLGPNGKTRPGSEGLTTPGPVQVSEWLRKLVDEDVEAVVFEASSHALEQRRLDGVRFRTAVFTNLTRDHLDYHGSWDAYFSAKSRLLGLVSPGGTVIVNGEVPEWEALPVGELDRISYGFGEDRDLRAADVSLDAGGSRFRLEWRRGQGASEEIRLPLLGSFNVENALAAAAVALVAGQTLESVAAGLESAPQIPGRMEVVLREPFQVLVDYAHTPDALERAVETLRPLAPGRLTVVFGAGGNRDREKRPLMGAAVAGVADRIFVTSDNPRGEDPDAIIDDIVPGLDGVEHVRIADRGRAIRAALESAEPGEMVLLAGKGHETYQEIDGEKRPFDERALVRDWRSQREVT
ncbi:MAG: UDP-N-acetylmuramoyl-L-alanyl-D-glutamate--2,6-diaminopimelate ligase [Longimicrobiales bacterium]|nr:UDP-N-acetylmuramoyl-L-alanyl-D-glutamate--2,6-diaminopimelate ligase [Longimicrobiales bacterium]